MHIFKLQATLFDHVLEHVQLLELHSLAYSLDIVKDSQPSFESNLLEEKSFLIGFLVNCIKLYACHFGLRLTIVESSGAMPLVRDNDIQLQHHTVSSQKLGVFRDFYYGLELLHSLLSLLYHVKLRPLAGLNACTLFSLTQCVKDFEQLLPFVW